MTKRTAESLPTFGHAAVVDVVAIIITISHDSSPLHTNP